MEKRGEERMDLQEVWKSALYFPTGASNKLMNKTLLLH